MNGPVVHVISGLRTGGAEGFLVALAAELRRRDVDQHVVSLTAGGPNEPRLGERGIPVTVLDPRRLVGRAPAALFRLARLLGRLRPAVVQGWLYHGDLFATGAHRLALRRGDAPLAWGLRNSELDDARYGRLLRMEAALSGWPDLVIANSEAGARFHLARGYRPRRLAVIPNGIDTTRFRPDLAAQVEVRRALGLAPGAVMAIHAARVDPMKDHPTLLAAAERCPQIAFVLLGAGTEELRPLPANVRALGRRERPERVYAAGDITVSSSAFGEGFSNAVAEGMAAGLVPVATDTGDARTLVGETGRIVPPRDPAALATALAATASMPRGGLLAAGLRARARIEQQFSLARAADRFVAAWSGELTSAPD